MASRAATIAEVRARLGPAYTDPPITDDVVQTALDDVACLVSVLAFGDCTSQAQSLAAAACVAGSPYAASIPVPEGFGALVSAHANGPASRSFALPALEAADGDWALTWWGRKFLEFRRARWGLGSAQLARTSLTARPGC